jgi:acyl-CoA dehydrogenase
MRTVGACRHALDLMCRRAVSRTTRDGRLSDLQMVQEQVADAWIAVESFRLLVLRTAWLIDKHKDYNLVRKDIAAIKVAMPKVYHDVATKAAHLHGALGVSNEMPFMGMVTSSLVMGIADGPTEVHKVTLAKQILRGYQAENDLFPSYHIPRLKEEAERRFAPELAEIREHYSELRRQGAPA